MKDTTFTGASIQGVTTSNGFVDVLIVSVENQPEWVLPEKLIIAVQSVAANVTEVQWQGRSVPVLNLLVTPSDAAMALVLNADNKKHIFALLVGAKPKRFRLRISSLRDYNDASFKDLPFAFQTVLLDGVAMQIPHIEKLEQHIFGL